jgi:hypothetical protein
VEEQSIRQTVVIAAAAYLLLGEPLPAKAKAEDQIDLMLQRGQIPVELTPRHGYSDFTNPLGKFMDLLAAGAVSDARAIQADACATWLATRQTSALSGKFWAWNVEINLDTLCARR